MFQSNLLSPYIIINFSIPTEILSISGKYDPNFTYKTTTTNLVLPNSMFVNGVAVHLENTKDCSTITEIGTMNSKYVLNPRSGIKNLFVLRTVMTHTVFFWDAPSGSTRRNRFFIFRFFKARYFKNTVCKTLNITS